MRVVVTGASGNVGTSLLASLVDEPQVESVLGIARRRPGSAFAKTDWAQADVAEDDLARTAPQDRWAAPDRRARDRHWRPRCARFVHQRSGPGRG